MKEGKVKIGYSKPYVAKYVNTAGTITYTGGRRLARGVEASYDIETSDDNNFYADNIESESDSSTFVSGNLNLTVDGLLQETEQWLMNLPEAGANGLVGYGDNQEASDFGVGYIYEFMSDGVHYFTPIIFPRVTFSQIGDSGSTREENIDWQTQELTAAIKRAEDANRHWKYFGGELETEAAAEAVITTFLGI